MHDCLLRIPSELTRVSIRTTTRIESSHSDLRSREPVSQSECVLAAILWKQTFAFASRLASASAAIALWRLYGSRTSFTSTLDQGYSKSLNSNTSNGFDESNPDSFQQRYPMDLLHCRESIKLHLILVLVQIKSQIEFLFPKYFSTSFEQAF